MNEEQARHDFQAHLSTLGYEIEQTNPLFVMLFDLYRDGTLYKEKSMIIDEGYKRRVRIVSKPLDTNGSRVAIFDAEKGEAITNAYKAVITLVAGYANVVELSYYKADPLTERVLQGADGDVIRKCVVLFDPEVDVTALEE